ncbi:Undecaprenyl-phosphate galactosephosphotransferase [Pseudonocardia sp. Ae717_Ps2]|uniref:exopolysaccharide biosynthesis polyprenyl glycosylphosphotransferase n=1 Tax=Pseudonocardia sp. Ae717_Ps2 TaxID=1885573 RepID=UPI00095C5A40|nr:Undecaprenyl-phosphate galactosephosphotransferase [Pseudonocardia sp. Ae717_Ps2]
MSSGSGLTGARLRRLAWDLEDAGADLIVDPGLMEIAGPRLHVRPVDGFPLLALSRPKLGGVRQVVKTSMDVLGALALLVLVAPVLLLIAVLIRSDGGPVFFRQRRVGLGGTEFQMIKFRSMVPAAEDRLVELAASDTGAGPLFKMRSDPRVTRVGRVLRRYSLDELPQLFNVLSGSMSLVGPRPPLPAEVATYGPEAARKFLVKPGMTGLWQVSGRSDLSWEESVRLDLRYVENWSLTGDLVILWKTLHAVLGSHGAY